MPKEKKPSLLNLSTIAEDPSTAGPERPLCQKCGLFNQTTNPFLNPPPAKGWAGKLLLLGEAPGAEEERAGRFFVGKAGKLIHDQLQAAGYRVATDGSPTDATFWNAVRCRPKDNKTPTMEQVRCCRPYVIHTVRTLKPQVVLALGSTAAKSLLNSGDATITKHRGRPLTWEEGDGELQTS